MAKIFIQPNGEYTGIGIEGNKQEREETYNLFFNWGAVDGELNEMSDSFAFFYVTPERLQRKAISICLNRLMINGEAEKYKGIKGGLWARAKDEAQKWLASFTPDRFIPREETVRNPYSFGVTEGITAWKTAA